MSIKLKNPYILVLALSSISLLIAFFVECIMNFATCPLCIYQRFPYLIFIMLTLMAFSGQKNCNKYFIITALCACLLAGYHTGIERGLFELSSFCTPLVSIKDNLSATDFKEMLYNQQIGMCNEPPLIIFGFSMAEWNLLLNLCLLTIFVKFKNC